MLLLQLLLPALAALVLAAHFYRAGSLVLALVALALIALLAVRRPWSPRLVVVGLLAGAVEWALTLFRLVEVRQAMGQPWTRLALIIGAVALATTLSTLVFRSARLRRYFRIDDRP